MKPTAIVMMIILIILILPFVPGCGQKENPGMNENGNNTEGNRNSDRDTEKNPESKIACRNNPQK